MLILHKGQSTRNVFSKKAALFIFIWMGIVQVPMDPFGIEIRTFFLQMSFYFETWLDAYMQ